MQVDETTRAAFQQFDADGSGDIDASELRRALSAVGLTVDEGQVGYMLRKYDDDRGATLDLDEFAQLVEDIKSAGTSSLQERLHLRTHPDVVAALAEWWRAALCSLEPTPTPTTASAPPVLYHDDYMFVVRCPSTALALIRPE